MLSIHHSKMTQCWFPIQMIHPKRQERTIHCFKFPFVSCTTTSLLLFHLAKKMGNLCFQKQSALMKTCPHIAHSPLKDDAVLVPDPNDLSKKTRNSESFLRVSIHELHNNLIALVPSCTKNGNCCCLIGS